MTLKGRRLAVRVVGGLLTCGFQGRRCDLEGS